MKLWGRGYEASHLFLVQSLARRIRHRRIVSPRSLGYLRGPTCDVEKYVPAGHNVGLQKAGVQANVSMVVG